MVVSNCDHRIVGFQMGILLLLLLSIKILAESFLYREVPGYRLPNTLRKN
jgi:hypothetical protein